jgi:hypothetical protein
LLSAPQKGARGGRRVVYSKQKREGARKRNQRWNSKALEAYRLYCIADGKSRQTTWWYLRKLRILGGYLKVNGYPTELREITWAHIRAFLVYLRSDANADQLNAKKHGWDELLSGCHCVLEVINEGPYIGTFYARYPRVLSNKASEVLGLLPVPADRVWALGFRMAGQEVFVDGFMQCQCLHWRPPVPPLAAQRASWAPPAGRQCRRALAGNASGFGFSMSMNEGVVRRTDVAPPTRCQCGSLPA